MPEIIYRFDLDKTYLKTEFETLKGLLKAALEQPEEKESYEGADILLREMQKNPDNKIFFISGSPEQMRRKLEKKLRLDGIKWEQLVLKPNLKNLLLGRFHALREQVSYKLPVLLSSKAELESPAKEVLFGDDAESDAFVYSLYSDVIAGKIKIDVVVEVLRLAKAHKETYKSIKKAFKKIKFSDDVIKILIHLDRKSPPKKFEKYGKKVVPFYNYFQASLILYNDNLISIGSLLIVINEMITRKGYNFRLIANSFQDLVRRGIISINDAIKILDEILEETERISLLKDKKFYTDMQELMEMINNMENRGANNHVDEFVPDYINLYVEKHRREGIKRKGLIESLFD